MSTAETPSAAMPNGWQKVPLNDLNRGRVSTINPANYPDELFEYYSIPAYQDGELPTVVSGKEIGSSKLVLTPGTVLFGKLNPRVEKVWCVRNETAHRKIGSTEWMPIVANDRVDNQFVYFLLWSEHVMPRAKTLVSGSTPSRQRVDPSSFYKIEVPLPPLNEQRKIAFILSLMRRGIGIQERLVQEVTELKASFLKKFFTEGLRGEPQAETEIGQMPESWGATPLGECCYVLSGSLSYTDFLNLPPADPNNSIECMAVKVSDMNLPGNEIRFLDANAKKRLSATLARKKLIPPNAVVFPKRGAAIATNKKRLTTTWTVLDPNLIAVLPREGVDCDFLFFWTQTFDLKKITDPGPTPQLNKKDLTPLLMPVPPDIEEQREIAAALLNLEAKIDIHQRRLGLFRELFRTLLHQLLIGEIRVDDLDLSKLESVEAA
jgi:type I restriction enzyme, S subunit